MTARELFEGEAAPSLDELLRALRETLWKPARPHLQEAHAVAAQAKTGAEVWELCAARGLIPTEAVGDPGRLFGGKRHQSGWRELVETPRSTAEAALLASNWQALVTVEALQGEAYARRARALAWLGAEEGVPMVQGPLTWTSRTRAELSVVNLREVSLALYRRQRRRGRSGSPYESPYEVWLAEKLEPLELGYKLARALGPWSRASGPFYGGLLHLLSGWLLWSQLGPVGEAAPQDPYVPVLAILLQGYVWRGETLVLSSHHEACQELSYPAGPS